ncbi:MAG: tannase/feruloyl esterase family alpha/beta hydrolase [Pseudohongiellaceae bacterium]
MFVLLTAAAIASAISASSCQTLTGFNLENASINSAEVVAAGVFQAAAGPNPNNNATAPQEPIPAHCRVKLLLTPTSDSKINVELWLPMENWNGRYLAIGNGGWAGSIQGYGDMQMALRRGYATAASDAGHTADDGPNGMFALGHPEKIVDLAFRAIHDMTDKSKRIITKVYQQPADYSYYKGCSTGGRQGVMAAQRYPGDFDGIIAGALANRHIHMHTAGAYRGIDLNRHPEKAIPEATAKVVNDAVMQQCDVLKEGFLNDPRQCNFDLATLACKVENGVVAANESCLTPPQLQAVQEFYGGLHNSSDELIFSGQALGNRLPVLRSTGETPGGGSFDSIRILGFQNENYAWQDFDLDRDMPLIDAATGFVDAVDPDLRAFEATGAKLLMYAGWNDTTITPLNTVYYYESVLTAMGSEQADWMRLFMVPGMGHCRGGDGPFEFDMLTQLEQWREQGQAPAAIAARNPTSGLSRPLCAYPQTAIFDGTGDIKDAGNWSCAAL